jgi:hypothetical protein
MGQRAAVIARSRFSQGVARAQVCDLVPAPHGAGAVGLRPESGVA